MENKTKQAELAYKKADEIYGKYLIRFISSQNIFSDKKYQEVRYNEYLKCTHKECLNESKGVTLDSIEFAKCVSQVFYKCRKFAYTINQSDHSPERKSYYQKEEAFLKAKEDLEKARKQLQSSKIAYDQSDYLQAKAFLDVINVGIDVNLPYRVKEELNKKRKLAKRDKNDEEAITKAMLMSANKLMELRPEIDKMVNQVRTQKSILDQDQMILDQSIAKLNSLREREKVDKSVGKYLPNAIKAVEEAKMKRKTTLESFKKIVNQNKNLIKKMNSISVDILHEGRRLAEYLVEYKRTNRASDLIDLY